MHVVFRVNSPDVVANVIDGEAIIVDLKSGQYFSCNEIGSVCWTALAGGQSVDQLVAQLAADYDADSSRIDAAVSAFVAALIENDLIRSTGEEVGPVLHPISAAVRAPFAAPVLSAYSDMRDLLLLDPIHDVDDAGWPMPKDNLATAK